MKVEEREGEIKGGRKKEREREGNRQREGVRQRREELERELK